MHGLRAFLCMAFGYNTLPLKYVLYTTDSTIKEINWL